MKNMKTMAAGMCLLTAIGCQTKQSTGALIGDGVGTALGGTVGQIAGHNGRGTAIGATIDGIVNAGAGTLTDRHMDRIACEVVRRLPDTRVDKAVSTNGLGCMEVIFDSDILFPLDGSNLSTPAKNDLTKFASLMQHNSNCDVAIQGYTDTSGNDSTSLPLPQRRADAVSSYLEGRGVNNRRIRSVQDFGSASPIENKTISQANRRVEIYLYTSSEMIRQANNGSL